MATPNPMTSPSSPSTSVSKSTIHIAGLLVDVYGLSELPPNSSVVSCLWLHHPRLRAKEDMATIASMTLSAWHGRQSSTTTTSSQPRGLIAVAFDQRNHGSRLAHAPANKAWRGGNKTHAQDMFSIISGTVNDTSALIDVLEGYIFPEGKRTVDQHLALGVSLGGHSVWQTMFREPRVTAGVVVIGCPDFMFLMSDRARKSKLETYNAEDSGAGFLGSTDFPPGLVQAAKKYDPKGIVFGTGKVISSPSKADQKKLRRVLDSHIKGKKFQLLSGGADKLVPYKISKPFLNFFKSSVEAWWQDGGVGVEDNVYPEVGHEFNEDMMKDAVRFITDAVAGVGGSDKEASAKI